MMEVVSAVIIRWDTPEPRVLLTQRRADQDYPFSWESPGGKVDSCEGPVVALGRELREELGLEDVALASAPLWEGLLATPQTSICITFYLVQSHSPSPIPREGQGIAWWTAEEFGGLSVLPGNQAARAAILQAMRSA